MKPDFLERKQVLRFLITKVLIYVSKSYLTVEQCFTEFNNYILQNDSGEIHFVNWPILISDSEPSKTFYFY